MEKNIRILCVSFLFVFLSIGCSGQNKDVSKSKTAIQEVKSDSLKKSDVSNPSDSPIVTFIELGSVKCIPCKMMQPIMEEIEKEYSDQVKVVFHDVWTEKGRPYADKYGIKLIPTQIFLDKNGTEYFRHEGYFPKEELVKVLKQQGVE